MKKIYYFFVNSGKVLFIYSVLFLVAISLNSFAIKGEINYGNRCIANFNKEIIKEFSYEGVELSFYSLECNTYNLRYISRLSEEKEILFLASLSKFLSDKDIKSDIRLSVINDNHLLLASIVNYQISYTKTIY